MLNAKSNMTQIAPR